MALVTSSDAAAKLAAINQAEDDRLKKQGNGKVQIAFAKDVKNSLLFQYDWAELLSAAPLALSLMGSCYVAATSPLAKGISLADAAPKGGFVYIKYPSLQACLVQVSDSGRFAFLEAEKKMGLIASTSTSLSGYMGKIVDYLGYLPHPDAESGLNNNLQLLKSGSDDCLRYATDVEQEFKKWLALVCELHQVTVAKEEKTTQDQIETDIKIAGVSVQAELADTSLKHADEAAKTMKDNLESSRKQFEKAADAVPGPWESMALNLVGSLAQTATATIGQGLPMMMASMVNPMAGLSMAAGGAANGAKNGGQNGANGKGRRGKQAQSITNPAVIPPNSDDPAYPASISVNTNLTGLVALLEGGPGNSIDWEHMAPKSPGERTGLTYVKSVLEYAQTNTGWTEQQPSLQLKAAIGKALQVITAIETEMKKDKGLTSKKADGESEAVKGWQKSVQEAKAVAASMATTAGSLPGSAPGAAPMLGSRPNPQAAAPSAQNAALTQATEKLQMTQAAYESAQANYQKAAENRSKVEADLARIKANLKSLEAAKMTMDEIKKILIQCIGTLIQMKSQITNLVRFFSALSAMVEHVVKNNVKEFMLNVESAKKTLIAGYSMLDFSRQELYTTSLMVQAYFSLFNSIATMYNKISINHIMPGVRLCDELSKSTDDPSAVAKRTRQLEEYSDNAQNAVKELVADAQRTITNTLEDRVKGVADNAKILPKLPESMTKAINSGADVVTSAAASGIDNHESAAVAADNSASVDEI
ncbi:hypothetical protein ABW19_dt0206211 [Dactylella cylindrospora]|nr:hypothetical protein ABW19_dt0206211 [Dactylella cylindrospora]